MSIDLKYVLKRVLVGVLVFVCITLLRKYLFLNVYAMEVSPYDLVSDSSNPTLLQVITNLDTGFDITLNDSPWAVHNGTSGYIHLSFAVNKADATFNSSIVFPRGVSVEIDNTSYICDIGSSNLQNTNYNGAVYSAVCPVHMGTSGLSKIHFRFNDFQSNDLSYYRVEINSSVSYEISTSSNVQVNVDTSSTTTAINNQTTAINNQTTAITQNQDENTQSINDNISNQFNKEVCTGRTCDNIFNNTSTGSNNRISYTWSNGKLTASGTTRTSTTVVQLLQSYSLTNSSGNYKIILSSSLPYDLQFTSTCTILAGATFTTCSFTDNQPLQINLVTGASATVDISNLLVYISGNLSATTPCEYGTDNTSCTNVNRLDELNDNLTNSNVDTTGKGDFFLNFDDTNPLVSLVTFPIELLRSATDTCTPVSFTYKSSHINTNNNTASFTIPCGDILFWNRSSLQSNEFVIFKTWWKLFVGGLCLYFVGMQTFHIISHAADPSRDDIDKVGVL